MFDDNDPRWGNEAFWLHRRAVARCAGAACFAAVARHFGSDSPIVLEHRIDRRGSYFTQLGTPVWAGTYRRWRDHGVVPSTAKATLISNRSGDSVDVRAWYRLLLWRLLDQPVIYIEPIVLPRVFPQQIARTLLRCSSPANDSYLIWLRASPVDVQSLFRLGSLDAFTALVLLARHSEHFGASAPELYAGVCAYGLLPQILYQTPVLRYRWRDLHRCIANVLTRSFSEPIFLDTSEHAIAVRLAELDSTPRGAGALIPPPVPT